MRLRLAGRMAAAQKAMPRLRRPGKLKFYAVGLLTPGTPGSQLHGPL